MVSDSAGLYLLLAESVNNRGEIVGFGATNAGEVHGFLAVPMGGDGIFAGCTSLPRPMLFDELLKRFLECEKPQDQEEVELVHQMAEASWLSRRSIRLQDRCILAIESGTPAEQKQANKNLSLYLRYMTTHDRAYSRYATELRKRRNERQRAERGFVSQKLREANEIRKKEMHELRQATEICKQQRREIQNRIAAAKAERLELNNSAKKQAKTMAAAA
jgi:hypothetical protein